MSKTIFSDQAPAPVGPYSQAVQTGGLIFCAGQIALKPDGTFLDGDLAEQAEQIMQNIIAVLAAADCTLENIVKTTIYLTDISDFGAVNEVYGKYFEQNPPARTTIAVKELPFNAKVEIEVVAESA